MGLRIGKNRKQNSFVYKRDIFTKGNVLFVCKNILHEMTDGKEGIHVADINGQIAKAEEEIRQLQNRRKKLLNRKKDEERKARTHRLIERGAILESLLEEPERYTNEQIKHVLETVLRTPQAQEFLRKIKAQREGN